MWQLAVQTAFITNHASGKQLADRFITRLGFKKASVKDEVKTLDEMLCESAR